ncbi:MAG: hypothetical protein AAGF95_07490, partial [Chloroflexota bacterium]
LAYQWPYTHQLDVGGNRVERTRGFDAPFVGTSFNASEPASLRAEDGCEQDCAWWQLPQEPYRWAKPDATMFLPGLGGGDWDVSIRARGHPVETPTLSEWSDGHTTTTVALVSDPLRVYHMLVQSDTRGDVTLHFTTPRYEPANNDPRSLGFVVSQVVIAPTSGLRWPALPQLGLLAVTVALVYGLSRRLDAPRLWVSAVGVVLVLAAMGMLMVWRLHFTIYTPMLASIAVVSYAIAALLLRLPPIDQRVVTTRIWPGMQVQQVVIALIVLAFALRLGGMVHPYTQNSDIGLNVNNMADLTMGKVYFTEGLPSETGGGQAPYPPGQYIAFAPLQLLLPMSQEGRQVLLQFGNALIDSLVVGMLWYVLWRSGVGVGASLLSAALYVSALTLLKSFSIGEFANIFGQGMALPLLALLATEARSLRHMAMWGVALVLMLVAFLGHLGVTISLALTLGWLCIAWVAARRERLPVGALVALGVTMIVWVGLFYYSAFAHLLFAPPTAQTAAETSTGGVSQIMGQLGRLLRVDHPLSALLVGLGATGTVLLGLHHKAEERSQRTLWLVLLAWWGTTLFSLSVFLFRAQGLRWEHFLYPALCLGAGPALAALWVRGYIGRLVALVTFAFLMWRGIALFIMQLIDYR